MPTLILATTKCALIGITAQPSSASEKVMTGASRNMTLFARVGMMVSFTMSLSPSAKAWNSPNGPTTLGPRRSCIAAMTLRSA